MLYGEAMRGFTDRESGFLFHQEVSTAEITQENDVKQTQRVFLRETKLKPSVCLCGSQWRIHY